MRQFQNLFQLHLNIMGQKTLLNVSKNLCEPQFNNTGSKKYWKNSENVVAESQQYCFRNNLSHI